MSTFHFFYSESDGIREERAINLGLVKEVIFRWSGNKLVKADIHFVGDQSQEILRDEHAVSLREQLRQSQVERTTDD